jgi:hypothetical protein
MKISESQIRRLIKEELVRVMTEGPMADMPVEDMSGGNKQNNIDIICHFLYENPGATPMQAKQHLAQMNGKPYTHGLYDWYFYSAKDSWYGDVMKPAGMDYGYWVRRGGTETLGGRRGAGLYLTKKGLDRIGMQDEPSIPDEGQLPASRALAANRMKYQ